LPTPQYFTPKGAVSPFAARSRDKVESPEKLQYSTQSRSSPDVPLPTLPPKYGCAPIKRQSRMISWVPNSLSSISYLHHALTRRGLFSRGPMPFCP
jgi:hypothetical protein